MKKYIKVSLKQLKQELGAIASSAAHGARIDVTRYNKPYLVMVGAAEHSLQAGVNAENFSLKPALKTAKKNVATKTLLEDRDED